VYDLIGDLHGHADALVELLRRLGYGETRGAWRHPERTAVFVGDFLDRGPQIRQTIELVRPMLEAGTALAVLGNHEWNAFCYHTEDPDAPGEHLRRHSERNVGQHRATREQLPPAELASHLAFLKTLPIRLVLPGANVVHAAWDEVAFAVVEEGLRRHGCNRDGITDAFLVEGSNDESLLFAALEVVLKGKEMALPAGASFLDKDDHRRFAVRVRWYAPPDGHSIATYALPAFPGIPSLPLPAKAVVEARPYPPEAPPVFFGHYWLEAPRPAPLAPNVVCLDYSVAKDGFLCAYRLGEKDAIDPARFVTVAPSST
jgi:hypothetical protein